MASLPENCDLCGFISQSGCKHDDGGGVEISMEELPKFCPLKEDELDAKRFKVNYRGENLYLLIVLYEGSPWEVFVEHAVNSKSSLQYMLASWDCNTRFISESLKSNSLEHVIGQLRKSSRLKRDLPAIIADKLEEWL